MIDKMFEVEAESGNARTGTIKTQKFSIKTPVFLPVATKASVKTLTPEEAKKAGCEAIIVNALHIYRKAFNIVERIGLHEFMKWDGIIFTDSGGFQSIKKFPAYAHDEGIFFKMPDGKDEIFTPEKSIEVQKKIGSDFLFALDDCPSYPYTRKRIEKAVERTLKWAKKCQGERIFAIVQGGIFEDLRKYCAEELSKLNFFGFAIGGLCIGEPKDKMLKIIEKTALHLPYEKPRHLMGVGSPEDIISCVKNGIDIFDSAFPTRNARHGTILTSKGKINLGKKKVKGENIDDECECYACRNFSLDYLNYLFKEKEMLGQRLATIHNLYFMNNLMKRIREDIEDCKI